MKGPASRRRDHMLLGEVVENVDPEGLGRIRVFVSGVLEPESLWCFPIGNMLGKKNGWHAVPEKGANVCVWLNQGDSDVPYFAPGPWGAPKGVSTLPEQTEAGDPNIVVFRWRNFVFVVDGRAGEEKTTFIDLTTGTRLDVERATGNFSRVVAGSQGNESATIKGNLSTVVQTGAETRTVALGRTTSIGANDAKTVTGNEANTVGGSRADTITGSVVETVGGASTETITLAKTISALLAVLITAGTSLVLTAGGALNLIGSSVSISSSGAGAMAAVGLMTQNFLGGILQTVVGAVVVGVTGVVTETVSGLWTMVVSGGLLIQGASIRVGTGSGGYKKLLTDSYHSLVHMTHTHPVIGAATGTPTPPSAPDLASGETQDLTAS